MKDAKRLLLRVRHSDFLPSSSRTCRSLAATRSSKGSTGVPDATRSGATTSVIPSSTGNGTPSRVFSRARTEAGLNPSCLSLRHLSIASTCSSPYMCVRATACRCRHELLGNQVANLSGRDACPGIRLVEFDTVLQVLCVQRQHQNIPDENRHRSVAPLPASDGYVRSRRSSGARPRIRAFPCWCDQVASRAMASRPCPSRAGAAPG